MAVCPSGFASHRFKDYTTNEPTSTCVRCGAIHADHKTPRVDRKKDIAGYHAAKDWAYVQWGQHLSWVVRRQGVCEIGRLTKDPRFGPPPWPVEIWGEGDTWAQALKQANQRLAALDAAREET